MVFLWLLFDKLNVNYKCEFWLDETQISPILPICYLHVIGVK